MNNKIPQGLPAAVQAWLMQASETLIESLGDELEALILFGSAAEGLMRASSDVNYSAASDSRLFPVEGRDESVPIVRPGF